MGDLKASPLDRLYLVGAIHRMNERTGAAAERILSDHDTLLAENAKLRAVAEALKADPMKDLDELDALHAAATAGPWEVSDRVDFWSVRAAEGETAFDDGSVCDEYRAQCSVPTRDAIVALHNAWPAISARLRAAEAEVERLRALSAEARDMLRDMPWRRGGDALVTRLARAALGEP